MLISTFVFLFFLFATYALFLVASRKSDARHARLQQRVAEALQESSTRSPEEAVQIMREDTMGGSPFIHDLLSSINVMKKLDTMLRQADTNITVSRLLFFCGIAGLMAGLAAYTVAPAAIAVLAAIIASLLPIIFASRKRKKRLNKFNSQLPDTLDLLSRSLSVGHAFSESLHQVAAEMPEPIATEFRITFEEQKLGLSTKAALDRLSERVPLLDLRLCVTAMHIQRETGGNLGEVLDNLASVIRERFKVKRQVRVLTAHGRITGWILAGMPPALAAAMMVVAPQHMKMMIGDPLGVQMIIGALVLQVIGTLIIRKLVDIPY